MRPGYKHDDRLLRAAMVGVSDPVGAPAEPSRRQRNDEQMRDPERDAALDATDVDELMRR